MFIKIDVKDYLNITWFCTLPLNSWLGRNNGMNHLFNLWKNTTGLSPASIPMFKGRLMKAIGDKNWVSI